MNFKQYYKILNQYASGQCLKGYCERAISKFQARFGTGKILDIGCGTGDWTKYLELQGYESIGVDFYDDKKRNDINFIIGDMHNLLFNAYEFDFIFNSGVFEHTLAPFISICEMNRILKINGKVLLIVPHEKNLRCVYMEQHISCFDIHGLANLFNKGKFKILETEIYDGEDGQHYVLFLEKTGEIKNE